MSLPEDIRIGGVCVGQMPIENDWVLDMHISSSPDIHASRRVSVHICDVCGGLFVPMAHEDVARVASETRAAIMDAVKSWTGRGIE